MALEKVRHGVGVGERSDVVGRSRWQMARGEDALGERGPGGIVGNDRRVLRPQAERMWFGVVDLTIPLMKNRFVILLRKGWFLMNAQNRGKFVMIRGISLPMIRFISSPPT